MQGQHRGSTNFGARGFYDSAHQIGWSIS